VSDDTLCPQKLVTRLEVIDETGRAYVRDGSLTGGPGVNVALSYQDDGRTLKIFVTPRQK
jgi:hypothetical protein